MERRLAAILAADVVGYSRLIEADEVGTLATLKGRRRDVLVPLVAKHQGRVFKVTGDGVLVEFASAVEAVQCAVEVQERFEAANAGLSEDRRIVLRIGVNLGDVTVEGGDLYGDGGSNRGQRQFRRSAAQGAGCAEQDDPPPYPPPQQVAKPSAGAYRPRGAAPILR